MDPNPHCSMLLLWCCDAASCTVWTPTRTAPGQIPHHVSAVDDSLFGVSVETLCAWDINGIMRDCFEGQVWSVCVCVCECVCDSGDIVFVLRGGQMLESSGPPHRHCTPAHLSPAVHCRKAPSLHDLLHVHHFIVGLTRSLHAQCPPVAVSAGRFACGRWPVRIVCCCVCVCVRVGVRACVRACVLNMALDIFCLV